MEYNGDADEDNEDCKIIYIAQEASDTYHCKVDIITEDTDYSAYLKGHEYLFISHGLSVVKYISDRIGVMYLGNIVELAESQEMFDHPTHPYTEALLSAIPTTDVDSNREMIPLEGDIPSPVHPPKGCKFHTRCKYCTEICKHITPELVEMRPGHFVACHNPLGVEKDS